MLVLARECLKLLIHNIYRCNKRGPFCKKLARYNRREWGWGAGMGRVRLRGSVYTNILH